MVPAVPVDCMMLAVHDTGKHVSQAQTSAFSIPGAWQLLDTHLRFHLSRV